MGRGATHWTHWFQPLTSNGAGAEKHDSFIGRNDQNGHPLLDLTGEQIIRGETDGSSFPSGGLRQTHEARGYTVWDPVSPAFLIHMKHGAVLYIPTSFVSWTKEALDNKTPLLKSEEKLSEQMVELLSLLGDESAEFFTRFSTWLVGCRGPGWAAHMVAIKGGQSAGVARSRRIALIRRARRPNIRAGGPP